MYRSRNFTVIKVNKQFKADFVESVEEFEDCFESLRHDTIKTWTTLRNCFTRGLRSLRDARKAMQAALDVCEEIHTDFEEFRDASIWSKVKEGIDLIGDAVQLGFVCADANDELSDVKESFAQMVEAMQNWSRDLHQFEHGTADFLESVVDDIGTEISNCWTSALMKLHRRYVRLLTAARCDKSGTVERDFLIWPKPEIDQFQQRIASFVLNVKNEVNALSYLRNTLWRDADAVKQVFDDTKAKAARLQAPPQWYDYLSFGITQVVQAVDLVVEFFGDFGDFLDLFRDMNKQVHSVVRGLQGLERQGKELWRDFLALGLALCSFAGIELSPGSDNPLELDIHFDSTSSTFLSQTAQRLSNFSLIDSFARPCQTRFAYKLEDLRLSIKDRAKHLVVYREVEANESESEESRPLVSGRRDYRNTTQYA